jgi:NitT/TauT family transport system permease protein
MALQDIQAPTLGQALRPNIWDAVALILVIGAMVLIVYGGEQTALPLSALDVAPVSLDPVNLPAYALRTTMRMLLAIVCSIIFTLIYAALAAKSRRAEMVLIPLLDILQSVPILGFLTFTVVFFLNLFPGRVFGAELACVFAIFTSQAWNMTFSLYQSIRNVPKDLEEASQSFHLSGWQRFWRLVLRGGVGGDYRRQYHGHVAGYRLLRRIGHSKTEFARDRLRNPDDASGHYRL